MNFDDEREHTREMVAQAEHGVSCDVVLWCAPASEPSTLSFTPTSNFLLVFLALGVWHTLTATFIREGRTLVMRQGAWCVSAVLVGHGSTAVQSIDNNCSTYSVLEERKPTAYIYIPLSKVRLVVLFHFVFSRLDFFFWTKK